MGTSVVDRVIPPPPEEEMEIPEVPVSCQRTGNASSNFAYIYCCIHCAQRFFGGSAIAPFPKHGPKHVRCPLLPEGK